MYQNYKPSLDLTFRTLIENEIEMRYIIYLFTFIDFLENFYTIFLEGVMLNMKNNYPLSDHNVSLIHMYNIESWHRI